MCEVFFFICMRCNHGCLSVSTVNVNNGKNDRNIHGKRLSIIIYSFGLVADAYVLQRSTFDQKFGDGFLNVERDVCLVSTHADTHIH